MDIEWIKHYLSEHLHPSTHKLEWLFEEEETKLWRCRTRIFHAVKHTDTFDALTALEFLFFYIIKGLRWGNSARRCWDYGIMNHMARK